MTLALLFLAALLLATAFLLRARTARQRRTVTVSSQHYLEQSLRDAAASPRCELESARATSVRREPSRV